MPRDILISRDEAEQLVDMLEEGFTVDPVAIDSWKLELAAQIRERFGMSTKEQSDKHKREYGL